MVSNNICNTRLSLTIGTTNGRTNENNHQTDQKNKFLVIKYDDYLFPSLRLGLLSSDQTYEKPESVSGVSSFSNSSVKRESEVSFEEVEVEKVLMSPKVCHGNEDQDEEGPRKKLRLTKEQSFVLEDSFKEYSTLNSKQKQALAKRLNLRPRQVEVWFQNRRARTKLKQTEVDYEVLKKCCETLKEENIRLHKELQEFKAMKLTGPLYMQLPAATLSMCPSCERITAAGGGNGSGENSSKISFSIGAKPHNNFYGPFANSPAAC